MAARRKKAVGGLVTHIFNKGTLMTIAAKSARGYQENY